MLVVAFGVAYYACAAGIWALIFWRESGPGPYAWNVVPAVALLGVCGYARWKWASRRIRSACAWVALGAMVLGSAYDYSRANYQLGAHFADGAPQHYYINWPWLTALPPR